MKNLTLIIFLILFPGLAKAETSTCFDPSWKQVTYESDTKGSVLFYITPSSYKPTATNLACIFGIAFLEKVSNVPEKAVIGLISEDYRTVNLIQWNLTDDYLLFLEVAIPEHQTAWTGNYTKYPQALERIKDILTNNPFPKPSSLPRNLAKKIRVNYVGSSIEGNKKLVDP